MSYSHSAGLAGALALIAVACASSGAPSTTGATSTQSTVAPFFFALSVTDVEASSAWYEKTLGFRVARTAEVAERGIRIRLLTIDGGVLELVETPQARPFGDVAPIAAQRASIHGIFKIGFRVADLDATISMLEQRGVALRGKAFTEPDGTMRSAQIEDPDGNIVQLFELLR